MEGEEKVRKGEAEKEKKGRMKQLSFDVHKEWKVEENVK